MPPTRAKLQARVAAAAEAALREKRYVSPVDVLVGVGWVAEPHVESWRHGRVEHLEQLTAVGADRVDAALAVLEEWARGRGLEPTEVDYTAATRDRTALVFTADRDPVRERGYRIHWAAPGQPAAKQEAAPDLVVIIPLKDWTCAGCAAENESMLVMERGKPLCLTCADLDHLAFLPRGDAALTRRAKKASGLSAVAVQFSRTRKRYERQGILVEPAALEEAERQCLDDEEVRARRRERDRERRADEDVVLARRMAERIRALFPGCPPDRAAAVAAHTALRGSGRVGRSAAGRALDDEAITLAVAASVRHEDTHYDALLMSGVDRTDARRTVRPVVDLILERWRAQGSDSTR
jgi:hypothetical protein